MSYTVELASDGRIYADGEQVADVGVLVAHAKEHTQNVTAVFFSNPASSASARAVISAILRGSGFQDVRLVPRGAPSPIRAEPVVPPKKATDKKRSKSRRRPRSPKVQVKTVGLHVGGGARSEASRQRLVRRFEKHLPAMARCHRLADRRTDNALYGVDVYVPRAGGKAKLGDIRSRLKNKKFRRCMHRVIAGIRFRPPESGRRTAISYSLLFKPASVRKGNTR